LAYMAPEQIQGSDVDARSDLFSFGILLFEMLSGHFPFRGDHEAAMMYSILNEQPDSIRKYLPNISATCERIFEKALEKNPDERYQTAADMVADLKRWKRESGETQRVSAEPIPSPTEPHPASPSAVRTTAPHTGRLLAIGGAVILIAAALVLLILHPWSGGSSDRKTLVVMPFENQSDPSREYFADGLTEEITTRLSGLSGIGVIARSSAKSYKGTKKSIKEISAELGVDYVLMGTVRWSESTVRVSPELVRSNSGVQLWAQTFDAPFSDAFTLQSDIASKVASALDIKLLKPEAASLGQKLTTNAEAYDLYLRGVTYMDRSSVQSDQESAIQLFQRATQLDPMFAAAYAKTSYAHSNMYWFFYDRSQRRIDDCRKAVEKALSLAPSLPAAHEAMAWYYYHAKLDYVNALGEFSSALSMQPNNPDVYYGMAAVYRRQGRMRESVDAFRKAVEGNPRAADLVRQLGETLTLNREYEEADRIYARTLELAPDVEDAYQERAENFLLWKGDVAAAQRVIEEGLRFSTIRESEPLNSVDFTVAAIRNDYAAAEKAIARIKGIGIDNQFTFCPTALLLARLESLRGAQTKARAYYESARVILERKERATPDDERVHTSLGIAYAGLGRTEEAIREGERGVALLPVEKEAWRGSFRLADLAQIYAMTGNQEKAVDLLQRLLAMPSEFSATSIRLDPRWASLRGNKRFEALVKL
ncbi:MAG TPA: protein kinase, partial [Bacteroidota bacterium]|nr:protein kinase [Bacteroidota bacterium]